MPTSPLTGRDFQISGWVLAQRATRRAGDRMYHALAPVIDAAQLETLGYEPIPDDDPDAETPSYGRGPR